MNFKEAREKSLKLRSELEKLEDYVISISKYVFYLTGQIDCPAPENDDVFVVTDSTGCTDVDVDYRLYSESKEAILNWIEAFKILNPMLCKYRIIDNTRIIENANFI